MKIEKQEISFNRVSKRLWYYADSQLGMHRQKASGRYYDFHEKDAWLMANVLGDHLILLPWNDHGCTMTKLLYTRALLRCPHPLKLR